MNETRIGLKVGIFVAAGLALLALLVLSFSRGLTLFNPTYHLRVIFPTAAGLKPTADVMMSGVVVGKAFNLELSPDEQSVVVDVGILTKYKIRSDAVFHIDALGFLGDQYISVTPTTNFNAAFLQNDAVINGESPFNMQEAIRSVSGLLEQAKKTVIDADRAINTVNKSVLSDQTMTNFSLALSNIDMMTSIAVHIAQSAEELIHSNTPTINTAVTNLQVFSAKLDKMADDLSGMVATDRPMVDETLRNLRDTAADFKQVAADLEAGRGVVGGLLKDQEMKAQTEALISNANATAAALSTFGSNLNQKGIWRMLWKPKNTERSEENREPAK